MRRGSFFIIRRYKQTHIGEHGVARESLSLGFFPTHTLAHTSTAYTLYTFHAQPRTARRDADGRGAGAGARGSARGPQHSTRVYVCRWSVSLSRARVGTSARLSVPFLMCVPIKLP